MDNNRNEPNQVDNHYSENNRYERQPSNKRFKRPWYNKGLVWLFVAAIGIGVLFFALSGLTDEVANVNQSLQEQTVAIEEQTQVMDSIKEGMNDIVVAIKDAANRITDSIS
ncbi:hypothetical protein ACFFHM_00485 [Halalkalibacter kiskunsagensis]|uniref:Uncharacterized protein n=1 Tax=Halalkalibacter kiskunsagensis TaxID=1548599 RepID=A0ABV6K6Z8_9BACI